MWLIAVVKTTYYEILEEINNISSMPSELNFVRILTMIEKIFEQKHYRFLAVSLVIHTLIYALAHLAFEPAQLLEMYLVDIALLGLCAFGTAKRLALLIFPSLLVKIFLVGFSVAITMMCLSNMNIEEKSRESRMEFRRQRNYPDTMNLLLEDHPSVCIWIYLVMTLVTMDLSNGLKAFYSAFDCSKKKSNEVEKPPSYSKCVSTSVAPPTYSEAVRNQENINHPNFNVV